MPTDTAPAAPHHAAASGATAPHAPIVEATPPTTPKPTPAPRRCLVTCARDGDQARFLHVAPWVQAALALLDVPMPQSMRQHPWIERLRGAQRNGTLATLALDVQQTAHERPNLQAAPLREQYSSTRRAGPWEWAIELPRPIHPDHLATTRVGLFLYALAWAVAKQRSAQDLTLPLDPAIAIPATSVDAALFTACVAMGPTLAAVSAEYCVPAATSSPLPAATVQRLGGDSVLYAVLAPRLAAAWGLVTDEHHAYFTTAPQRRAFDTLLRLRRAPGFCVVLTLHAHDQAELLRCHGWQQDRATGTLFLHATCRADAADFLPRLTAGDLLYFLWTCEAYAGLSERRHETALTLTDTAIGPSLPTARGTLTLFQALHPLTAPDDPAAVGPSWTPQPASAPDADTSTTDSAAATRLPFTIHGPPQLVNLLRPFLIRGLTAFDDTAAAHFTAHGRERTYRRLERLFCHEGYQLDVTIIPHPASPRASDGEVLRMRPAVINSARRRVGLTLELPQRHGQLQERFWHHLSRRALLFLLAEAITSPRATHQYLYDPARHCILDESALLRALLAAPTPGPSVGDATAPTYAHVRFAGDDVDAFHRVAPLLEQTIALMTDLKLDRCFPHAQRNRMALSTYAQLRDAVARAATVHLTVVTTQGGNTPTNRRTALQCVSLNFGPRSNTVECTLFLAPDLSAADFAKFTPGHLLFALWAQFHRGRAWSGLQIHHGRVTMSTTARGEQADAFRAAFVRVGPRTAPNSAHDAMGDDVDEPDSSAASVDAANADPERPYPVVSPRLVDLLTPLGFDRAQLELWPEIDRDRLDARDVAALVSGQPPQHVGQTLPALLLARAARTVDLLTLLDAHLHADRVGLPLESRTRAVRAAAQSSPFLAASIAALGSAELPDELLPRAFQHPIALELLRPPHRLFPDGSRLVLHWLPGEPSRRGMQPTPDKHLYTVTSSGRHGQPSTFHLYACPAEPAEPPSSRAFRLAPDALPFTLRAPAREGGPSRAATLLPALARDLLHLANTYRGAPASLERANIVGAAATDAGPALREAMLAVYHAAQAPTAPDGATLMQWLATPRGYYLERASGHRTSAAWAVGLTTDRGIFVLLHGRRTWKPADWAHLLLALQQTPAVRMQIAEAGALELQDANGNVITTDVHDTFVRLGLEAAFALHAPKARPQAAPATPPPSTNADGASMRAFANPHYRACRDRTQRDAYQEALRWFMQNQAKIPRDYRPAATDTKAEATKKRSAFLHKWHDADNRPDVPPPPFDYNQALAHWQTVMDIYDVPLA